MTRQILAFALVAATGGAAFADDKTVHSHATVEVLDDKAQIDDVISRMRHEQSSAAAQPPTEKSGNGAAAKSGVLKNDRPPVPLSTSDTHRALAPEGKNQPPGSRRPLRDNHNFEHAERPRPKRK